jgi:membrane protein required for colicin V production
MAFVDLAIVIIVVASILGGLAQGFFRSVCTLLGLIVGWSVASRNYERIASVFTPTVHDRTVIDVIVFVLIILLVMALFGVIGALLSKTFRSLGLGCLDGIAGAIFGLFQGVFLVTLGILIIAAFYPNEQWLAEAKLPRLFLGACHVSTNVTPSELASRMRQGLRSLENESRGLMHNDHP